MLQGPIPGMSLTQEPGNMPWENPPEFSDIYDVMQFYLDRIVNVETEDMLLVSLDEGASVETMAEAVTMSGTMNGRHSLDLAFLVNPYIRELIRYVAESANIEYIDSYAERDRKQKLPYRQVKEVVQEVFNANNKPMETTVIASMPSKGLMARVDTEEPVIEEE
jgi:hypothetical protein